MWYPLFQDTPMFSRHRGVHRAAEVAHLCLLTFFTGVSPTAESESALACAGGHPETHRHVAAGPEAAAAQRVRRGSAPRPARPAAAGEAPPPGWPESRWPEGARADARSGIAAPKWSPLRPRAFREGPTPPSTWPPRSE